MATVSDDSIRKDSQSDIRDIREYGLRIEQVFRHAVRAALLRHKQVGNPVVGLVDDKIVWVQPEDILIDEE